MCSTKFHVTCVKFTAFIAVLLTWAKKPPCLPNVHLINVRKLFRLPIPAYKACHFSSSVDLCLHICILIINSENIFFVIIYQYIYMTVPSDQKLLRTLFMKVLCCQIIVKRETKIYIQAKQYLNVYCCCCCCKILICTFVVRSHLLFMLKFY